jgi:hypothetical protein
LSPPSTTPNRQTIDSAWCAADAGNIATAAAPHSAPAVAEPIDQ